MKKHIIIGISLFSCFLMVSISLIPTVQSIEVEKEFKSIIESKIEQLKINPIGKLDRFNINGFLLYYIICFLMGYFPLYLVLTSYSPTSPEESLVMMVTIFIMNLLVTFITMVLLPFKFSKYIINISFFVILYILVLISKIIRPSILIRYLLHPSELLKTHGYISSLFDKINYPIWFYFASIIQFFYDLYQVIMYLTNGLKDLIIHSRQANII